MKPQYYPRGQTNGVHRWVCMYCARVNISQVTPTAFRLRCKNCDHIVWLGPAYHIPAGPATKKAKDATIPVWAGDEFSFDPLKFDPMPAGIVSPDSIKQRGRIAMVLIHDNFWSIQTSPEEAQEYVKERED